MMSFHNTLQAREVPCLAEAFTRQLTGLEWDFRHHLHFPMNQYVRHLTALSILPLLREVKTNYASSLKTRHLRLIEALY